MDKGIWGEGDRGLGWTREYGGRGIGAQGGQGWRS